MKPLLIIPAETKVRELDAKILLSVIALHKGFDVVFGALRNIKYLADLLDKGIFLDKSFANTKQIYFSRYQKLGHKITVLDEEGLVYFDAETYSHTRIHLESAKKLSLIFTWGDDQAEIIASKIGEKLSDRIKITGNPRFDLLRDGIKELYKDDISILQKKYGRIILINTNFGFFNRDVDTKSLSESFSNSPIFKKDPFFFDGWVATQEKVMRSFQEMLPQVQQHFPDHTLIIRPHPSERLDVWQDFAASMSNTKVEREGNIVPWIQACDALIHWNCTTAIEAFLLGKKAFAYRKVISNKYEQSLPNICSFHAYNHDQLISMLDQLFMGKLSFSEENEKERDAVLARHLASMEGKLAAEKIVDELLVLSSSFTRKRNWTERRIQDIKRIWRYILNIYYPKRNESNQYEIIKFPNIEVEEVECCLNKINRCLGYNIRIDIKKIENNCFYLSSPIMQ